MSSLIKSKIDSALFMKLNMLIKEIIAYLDKKYSEISKQLSTSTNQILQKKFDQSDNILIKFAIEGITYFIENQKLSSIQKTSLAQLILLVSTISSSVPENSTSEIKLTYQIENLIFKLIKNSKDQNCLN